MLTIPELLDLDKTLAAELFANIRYPWEALGSISEFLIALGAKLDPNEYRLIGENVWAATDAEIFPSAYIAGPCIIDHGAHLRHCAFVRGSAMIGKNAVVGNSVEVKNSILFDNVETPHYNYVGDSILGFHAHMGAGSITSNVKSDRSLVQIHGRDFDLPTDRKKVGAILGDYVEIGCNSVLNPGTVVGRNSVVYPLSNVRGIVPPDSIYKAFANVARKK